MSSELTRSVLRKLSAAESAAFDPSWFFLTGWSTHIDAAISVCYAVTWAESVEGRFIQNAETGYPESWFGLGKAIGKQPNGFTRFNPCRGGKEAEANAVRVPTTLVRYSVSAALGANESELSPDTHELLARTARFLVCRFGQNALPLEDYQQFSKVSLAAPKLEDKLHSAWSDDRMLTERILLVAEQVGEILLTRLNWKVK